MANILTRYPPEYEADVLLLH